MVAATRLRCPVTSEVYRAAACGGAAGGGRSTAPLAALRISTRHELHVRHQQARRQVRGVLQRAAEFAGDAEVIVALDSDRTHSVHRPVTACSAV